MTDTTPTTSVGQLLAERNILRPLSFEPRAHSVLLTPHHLNVQLKAIYRPSWLRGILPISQGFAAFGSQTGSQKGQRSAGSAHSNCARLRAWLCEPLPVQARGCRMLPNIAR